ncbi:MAG: retinoid hydroxylase [Thermoanaerobaculia bacterium]|jgi:cytochrome P450|nr:retinoid hydroxylase [Thermoanaerobaculia bacterium]
MSTTEAPAPAGSDGLPLLGETMSFAKNPFRFMEERLARHGRIFRTNVLGRKTAVIARPEAAGRLIDSDVIMREGSMPPHVQALFGGRSLPLLDGEIHSARKKLVNAAFNRAAITAYLPIIQQTMERYFRVWPGRGEIRWLDEMKRLSIEVICTTIMGMPPGAAMDRLREDYGILTNGFASLPINVPGTRYRRALQARDRILEVLRRLVRERKQTPTDDGLSRMLAAAVASDVALSEDDAALELHHIVIAGFIVFAELGAIVQQLTAHPEVRARLASEIAERSPNGPLTLETLMAMPYLLQVVNEVKRLTPIVAAVFGKTKKRLDFDGVSVPAGWMVMWAITPSHVDQSLYSNPTAFDPDRFSPERAEEKRHEHAFAPQGAGPATGHRCPGLDLATYIMEIFTVVLLRGYSWSIPPQNFEMDFSKTPPEPKDGLRATVSANQTG